MDKKLTRTWVSLFKICAGVVLASFALNANAFLEPAYYYGPDCDGFYHGTDCSLVRWVPCHWDPYGNYVPGYWLNLSR